MNRQCRLIGFVLSILTFVGCAQSVAGPTDSETHFLHQCKESCAEGLACICGVCTKVCYDDESCSSLPGDPTCVAPDLLEDLRNCRPSDPIDEPVCDVGCKSDSDCKALGKGFTCQSGFCREDTAPKADSSIKDDAGPTEKESAVDDGGVDASSGEKDAISILPEFTANEDAGNYEEVIDASFTGGLASGDRAPKPGEASPNAYGEPIEPHVISVHYPHFDPASYAGLSSLPDEKYAEEEIENKCGEQSVGYWSIDPSESQPCAAYYLCIHDCEADTDCDDGGSGNALPVCDIDGSCTLYCDEQRICPEGMVCITEANRGLCYWPIEIIAPGCPAWCELDPAPQGCPGGCAAEGVGCRNEEGYCCDGLVCGPDGYCIEGD
jgi:hypothetical protein